MEMLSAELPCNMGSPLESRPTWIITYSTWHNTQIYWELGFRPSGTGDLSVDCWWTAKHVTKSIGLMLNNSNRWGQVYWLTAEEANGKERTSSKVLSYKIGLGGRGGEGSFPRDQAPSAWKHCIPLTNGSALTVTTTIHLHRFSLTSGRLRRYLSLLLPRFL
jgi:hypothetical protein